MLVPPELPTVGPEIHADDQLAIEGENCSLTRGEFSVQISAAPVVDNDGHHAAQLAIRRQQAGTHDRVGPYVLPFRGRERFRFEQHRFPPSLIPAGGHRCAQAAGIPRLVR